MAFHKDLVGDDLHGSEEEEPMKNIESEETEVDVSSYEESPEDEDLSTALDKEIESEEKEEPEEIEDGEYSPEDDEEEEEPSVEDTLDTMADESFEEDMFDSFLKFKGSIRDFLK